MSHIYTSADQLIGKTPLLELTHIEKKFDLKAKILAKLEYFNPAGSVKDQTIMFYLTGTNLGSYFRKNVDDAMNAIDRNILHNSRVLVFIQPQRGLSMVLELYYTPRNDDYVPGAQFSYEHCKVDKIGRASCRERV